MADTLHLLIKPASGNCNMRCAYCFYADEAANRETPSFGVMDRETARILIEKSMDYAKKQCIFTFQGGEPTLAGLDYFKYFTETVRKSNKRNIPVSYNIQTNGYHLQEDWFPFLKENKFLAGVSLDGDAACHDYLRRDAKGKGTLEQVMKTIALFKKYGIDFNVLTVVTGYSAGHARQILQFFQKAGPVLSAVHRMSGSHKRSTGYKPLLPDTGEIRKIPEKSVRLLVSGYDRTVCERHKKPCDLQPLF